MHRHALAILLMTWAVGSNSARADVGGRAALVDAFVSLNLSNDPAERALLADAADGRLDQHSLFRAALIAGGMSDPAQRRRLESRMAGCQATLERTIGATRSARARAESVFGFLHENVLRGQYHEASSGVAEALEQGDFNCVSSAILYEILASACGLRVAAIEVPGHVRCRVWLEDGFLDIETTCLTWADACRTASGEGRLVSRDNRSEPAAYRELSSPGLVALVYYNRGIDALERREFSQAFEANVKSLRLDPASATARNNLLATLNNWSLDLAKQGRRGEALALLQRGIGLAPDYEVFRINYAVLRDAPSRAAHASGTVAEERPFDRPTTAN